ncbi:MAG: DinB family protein [Candidatus Rokuibacteriota bacterium]
MTHDTAAYRIPEPAEVLTAARRELARLPAALEVLVADLDDATWRARPAPDEWAPIEIVCHLRDEEGEDFPARLRVILAGGPHFAPIDPERWVTERRYREQDPRAVLAELTARRAASLAMLAGVPAARLTESRQQRFGPLSGLDLLVAWVTHDALHLQQLAGTLARLWATRWAPLKAEYAGPIPYPPAPAP